MFFEEKKPQQTLSIVTFLLTICLSINQIKKGFPAAPSFD